MQVGCKQLKALQSLGIYLSGEQVSYKEVIDNNRDYHHH